MFLNSISNAIVYNKWVVETEFGMPFLSKKNTGLQILG